ncbi:YceI family protein [Qipengyuania qiaonensis]|uniref:YceI family protein n=1 Tax=Qipengyuania qiaonensis TaxID=2867240 RepID=A0ABS7JD71_9SPHN|nr:YceI family protein [Qipengyuania qiaonensis]MBX7483779.1 YceI family protein [Qipengyuania qiaonensis]
MQVARCSVVLSIAALVGAATAGTTSYMVDTAGSNVSAKVAFLAIGSKTADFPDVSGSARLSPTDPQRVDLDIKIDARTLTASDKTTQNRLKGEKFFWVEKYPMVRFLGSRMVLTDERTGTVQGSLTARGVTRPVTLTVAFDTPPADAGLGAAITLTGEATIDRREFGMKSYSLIVGRTVNITLKARLRPAG